MQDSVHQQALLDAKKIYCIYIYNIHSRKTLLYVQVPHEICYPHLLSLQRFEFLSIAPNADALIATAGHQVPIGKAWLAINSSGKSRCKVQWLDTFDCTATITERLRHEVVRTSKKETIRTLASLQPKGFSSLTLRIND